MSGRRLLDAIQFLNVAGSVATKHLAVRQRQLDVFTRTSSLTKGVKSQADGIILTAQAAAALAKRFNEPSPPSGPKATDSAAATQPSSSSNARETDGKHEFAGTATQSTGSDLSPDAARKLQRQAEFQIPASTAEPTDGLADGLGVSQQQDVFYKPSQESSPGTSSLPRMKLPHSIGNSQGGVGQDINADVFHFPLKAGETSTGAARTSEKEDLPDEMMKDIFHSPKVARMLSNKPKPDEKGSDWRTSRYAKRPVEHSTSATSRTHAKQTEDKDMEALGSNIAENVASSPEVRS